MTYTLDIPEHLDQKFSKLAKKDKLQFEILTRKINEILENPKTGEPLTGNMAGERSVHVRHFCLIYEILENEKVIKLLDYDHRSLS